MTGGLLRAALAAASLAATLNLSAHSKPDATPVQQAIATGTGFLAGEVIETPSGRPVPGAEVTLTGRVTPPSAARGGLAPVSVLTDSQGRFFFANLPAGTFSVFTSRPGFEPAARGSQTQTFELVAGQRVTAVKMRLIRLASVAGIVLDESGGPVVNTEVVLIRRAVINGRRTMVGLQAARTDDRGEYRVSRLTPGEYIVCACARDPNPFDGLLLTTLASEPANLMSVAARALVAGPDVVSLDRTLRTYALTFHPNSTTVARAAVVTIAPGDEKTAVDITVSRTAATRVSGRLVGAHRPVQASEMRLVPALDAGAGILFTQIPPMLVQADGRFDFVSVPPGTYRLMVVTHAGSGGGSSGPSGIALGFAGGRHAGMTPPPPPPPPAPIRVGAPLAEPPLWANEIVTVPEAGVSDIVVALTRTPTISGRVQFDDATPPPAALGRATLSLQPIAGEMDWLIYLGALISPDGTFAVPGALPGKFAVNAPPLPGFPTVQSVTVGGVDITDLPLDVDRRDIDDLLITYSAKPPASLSVTVDAVPGEEFDGAVVLLFPAESKYWPEPAAARRRFRVLPLSKAGSATAPGLPAGDYFVLFATEQDAIDWQEPSKIAVLSKRAQPVAVLDGETKTIKVQR